MIGALGRSGRGARVALAEAGLDPTCWDLAETRDLDRQALLEHELMVNTVLTTGPSTPSSRTRTWTSRAADCARSAT